MTSPRTTDINLNWPYDKGMSQVLQGNESVHSVTLNLFASSHRQQKEDQDDHEDNSCKRTRTNDDALKAIQTLPNLQRLHVHSATGQANAWLSVQCLTQTLQACPNVQEVTLHGIGFVVAPAVTTVTTNDHPHANEDTGRIDAGRNDNDDWDELTTQCRTLAHLRTVSVTDMYFERHLHQQPPQQHSWLQCSRFCQALARLPHLQNLQLSAIPIGFSRPALTLSALRELWEHTQLRTLSLQHFTLWGGDCRARHCAAALRTNQSLRQLHFCRTVFASDDSVLAGLDANTTLQQISLSHCMLHPTESAGLARALRTNTQLQQLALHGTRLGVDGTSHQLYGRACLVALIPHPALRSLDVRWCCGSHSDDHNNNQVAASVQDQHAIERLVTRNRILTEVRWCHEENASLNTSSTIAIVAHALGLNRAQFWQLSQSGSSPAQWVQALAVATDQPSCLLDILRENPLLCSGGTEVAALATSPPSP